VRSIILDTDIGSDVDDAMALALVLGRPDLDLVGITTVYGDTALRARLAARYASLAGRRLDVHAGIPTPLSGRDVWWAGHEGSMHPGLDGETYASDDAVSYLVETVAARSGELDVVAIGPLTNIAAALRRDPAFTDHVRTLWVMGGSFEGSEVEHNFLSDAEAARVVFESGIPTVVTGLDATRRIVIQQPQLDRIRTSGELGASLARDIDQWWSYWNETWNVPHDPVTVLTLAEPRLFQLSPPGRVSVTTSGDDEGLSVFEAGEGDSRIVTGLHAGRVSAAIVEGIVRSSQTTGRLAADGVSTDAGRGKRVRPARRR
jgi:purine nucleosidase